jgi:hypothetical protein
MGRAGKEGKKKKSLLEKITLRLYLKSGQSRMGISGQGKQPI